MSYYQNVECINIYLKNKEDRDKIIKEFRKKRDQQNNKLYFYKDLSITYDGLVYLNNITRNNFEGTDLADFLAPYVKGGKFVVVDDDGEKWAIIFDGKGSWKKAEGTTFYDFNSYEEFMKEYGEKLPKEVKLELERWYLAEEI